MVRTVPQGDEKFAGVVQGAGRARCAFCEYLAGRFGREVEESLRGGTDTLVERFGGRRLEKSTIRKALGIESIPHIIVVDKEGKIAAKNARRNILRERLEEILNKK